jgi:hypothetical protein
MNTQIEILLQEIANGESVAEVIRILEEDTVKGYERVKFLLGSSSLPVWVSLGQNSTGRSWCSIQVMIGHCGSEVEQNCLRLSDFMDGMTHNSEPKFFISSQEASEIWIAIDSEKSYSDAGTIDAQSIEDLYFLFEEIWGKADAVMEWVRDRKLPLDPPSSIKWYQSNLRDPGQRVYKTDDEYELALKAAINKEISSIKVPGRPELKFATEEELTQYLIDELPDSLLIECEYEGESYLLEGARNRVYNKAYGLIERS